MYVHMYIQYGTILHNDKNYHFYHATVQTLPTSRSTYLAGKRFTVKLPRGVAYGTIPNYIRRAVPLHKVTDNGHHNGCYSEEEKDS
jgi:hypothetical protein